MYLIEFLNLECPLMDPNKAIYILKNRFNFKNANEIYLKWRKDYIKNNFKNDEIVGIEVVANYTDEDLIKYTKRSKRKLKINVLKKIINLKVEGKRSKIIAKEVNLTTKDVQAIILVLMRKEIIKRI